ncbi:MAG: ParB/RepB/Spo0J family partition protein [bacterium]
MSKTHRLGRGLDALITDKPADSGPREEKVADIARIPIALIVPSPYQPRKEFAAAAMEELVNSIKSKGVLEPVLVRRKGEVYELMAGERRYRAAKEAKVAEIPVRVMDATDQEAFEIAFIENLHREDLNQMEEAEGYRRFAEQFGLTQEQIATRIGKARASVANIMRLLDLPEEVREFVRLDRIQAGHAKVLLGLEIPEEQVLLAKQVIKEGLSVRQLEVLVARSKRAPRRRRASRDDIQAVHIASITDIVRRHLGTSVRLTSCRTLANGKKVKGHLEMDYFSADDLNRILEVLGVADKIAR